MPELSHWPRRDQHFDYNNSEVVAFIRKRCGLELADAIRVFHSAANRGVIHFDHDTKMWSGCQHDPIKTWKLPASPYAHLWPDLAYMPPLCHKPDRSKPYAPERSEVLAWLAEGFRCDLDEADRIFRSACKQGVILFDPESGLWKGRDDDE